MREKEGGREEREGGRGRGTAMVVAANRWSANRQETHSTVLMWRGRERGGEGVREGEGGEGVREGERVGGGGGRGCYLPWLWLLIDGLPMGRQP